jgi:hypothetical protein
MVQTTAQNKLGFERTSRKKKKKRYVSHPHTGGKQRTLHKNRKLTI